MSWARWSTSSRFSFQLMIGVTIHIRSSRSLVKDETVDNKLPYIFVPIILLQHGYCTFAIILVWDLFTRLFINLTMCIRARFSKSAATLGLVEQAFWRVPLFTEWVDASSFKVILAGPSLQSYRDILPLGLFLLVLQVLGRFFLILLHERIRRWIRLCHFSTLIDIVTETAIVSFHTLPVDFPLSTISYTSWPRRSFHNFRFWPQNS